MATLGSLIFEMGMDLARLRSDMTKGVTIVESATKQMERAGEPTGSPGRYVRA